LHGRIVWEAIERRTDAPWIDSVSCSIPEVRATCERVEQPHADPELVRRQYRTDLDGVSAVHGRHRGELVIHYHESASTEPRKLPLSVDMLTVIAVVPTQLSFTSAVASEQESQLLTIFDRRGGPAPSRFEFDARILDVVAGRSTDGRLLELTVRPASSVAGAGEAGGTEIQIISDDGLTVTVPVVFEGAASAEAAPGSVLHVDQTENPR
jgi:hypothetical protein